MKSFALATLTLLGLTSAAPLAEEKRWSTSPNTITPSYLVHYNIGTGGITYNPSGLPGVVHWEAISTISTFNIPASLSGKKCALEFILDNTDTSATVTGSGLVQVFSSTTPPPKQSVEKWGPPGNQRNNHLGNFKVVKPGKAAYNDYPRTIEKFDCPKAGLAAYEVVAQWQVGVEWNSAVSGLYLRYGV